ncbi:hypothetical protein SAMN02745181_3629 [Rubritalea squalenifaciens DSM 18772]|uniref:Uncharacterized protein n=1 Tax=Rubritalea squalenifaciens DSM 18772 TaxID=1123071 RepID=A0A1M6RL19_9BACT|nr:hypothetical protein [Rubritalea squalenifaciens]SHK33120.1 hypothetical protein SAMN02745181_3629 [Rubritalea squalenifaciens DSM 18772]
MINWRGFHSPLDATGHLLSKVFSLLIMLSTIAGASELVRPNDLPSDYDLVGIYLVSSKTRVHDGKSIQQLAPKVTYKVFSNGQTIRVYNSDVPDAFHKYEIYRSDGISNLNQDGTTRVLPGLQAKNVQGAIFKQLSVSPVSLTITLIPPLSDAVTILYAKRIESK